MDLGNFGSSFSLANFAVLTVSTDSLALAYNGNRHMVRKPNTDQFHIVYANKKKVWYRYSSDAGSTWGVPFGLGKGKFPCIVLNSQGYPCVAWTDDAGGLWFRKYTGASWSSIYSLYNPVPGLPQVNAPPSMAVAPSSAGDTVHILLTLDGGQRQPTKGIADHSFPLSNPSFGRWAYIETEGPDRANPCLARCAVNNSLHAAWQRADTICYAVRNVGQSWNNWGWQFDTVGLQSAYPFIETYGDSIFVVWQHLETSGREEVYRARRYITNNFFAWSNLSQTTSTQTLYAVNASGLATVFVDEQQPPPPDGEFEVCWKRIPSDPLNNISQSPSVNSIYPQATLRFNQIADNELFVLWQEGNKLRYEIKFKREYVPDLMARAYITSVGGDTIITPYCLQRDTFFSTWSTPVDAGNNTLIYRFPLEPGYVYKLKATVYHQGIGEWRELVRIDTLQTMVIYQPGQPKTIEVWIPPALYENDGEVAVTINRIAGDYAIVGPVHIYQYETIIPTMPGGTMAQNSNPIEQIHLTFSPNPFTDVININGFTLAVDQHITIKVYDVAGRLVKRLYDGEINKSIAIKWVGVDGTGRTVPPGIYFIELTNADAKTKVCQKLIRAE